MEELIIGKMEQDNFRNLKNTDAENAFKILKRRIFMKSYKKLGLLALLAVVAFPQAVEAKKEENKKEMTEKKEHKKGHKKAEKKETTKKKETKRK